MVNAQECVSRPRIPREPRATAFHAQDFQEHKDTETAPPCSLVSRCNPVLIPTFPHEHATHLLGSIRF